MASWLSTTRSWWGMGRTGGSLHSLGAELENHEAVVDEVTCINPYDKKKGGVREIDTLQRMRNVKKCGKR